MSKKTEEATLKLNQIREQNLMLENGRTKFVSVVLDESGANQIDLEFNIGRSANEVDRTNRAINEYNTALKKIEETLPTLYRMKQEKLIEIENVKNKISSYKSKLEEFNTIQNETTSNLLKIQKEKERSYNKLLKSKARSQKILEKIMKYRQILEKREDRIRDLETKRRGIYEKFLTSREKSESFSQILGQLQDNMNQLKVLKETQRETLSNIKQSTNSIRDQRNKLSDEIAKAISTLDRASKSLLQYELERSIIEKVIPEEIGIRKLEELSETGAVDGFLGRLDTLISYDKQYERAVLASARRWLGAAVVQDIPSLLKIAEVAKRLKIGKLLILPLSELQNIAKIPTPSLEGVIQPISEIISVKEGFENLVNFVFGDTLLTSTPRAAYMASLRGFRAVTLSGDLFESKNTAFETGYFGKYDSIINEVQDESSISTIRSVLLSLKKMIKEREFDLIQLEKKSAKLDTEKFQKLLVLEKAIIQFSNINKFVSRYLRLQNIISKRVTRFQKILGSLDKGIEKNSINKNLINELKDWLNKKLETLDIQSLEDRIAKMEENKVSYSNSVDKTSSQIRDLTNQLTEQEGNLKYNLQQNYNILAEQIIGLEKENQEKTKLLNDFLVEIQIQKQKLDLLKKEETELIESKKKSKPILEDYETRIKNLRKVEEDTQKSINRLERELFSINRNIEKLEESDQRSITELVSLGYPGPTENFGGAELILEQITSEYEQLKDNVNLLADHNYRDIVSGYKNLSLRRNQLEVERNAIVQFLENVELEKKSVFISAFEKIDKELRIIFNKLTEGSAWLEIENPNDVFSGGVFLMTQFANKIPRESTSISGGEKTVTALSFVLAMQSVYPSPFYLFDEIDAHLDVVNVDRLADLLKEKSMKSQTILVSLKPSVLTRASLIHGVYFEDGISKVVRYQPGLEVMMKSA